MKNRTEPFYYVGKSILGKGNSKCKGPGGSYEGAMFKARWKVSVARTQSARRQEMQLEPVLL